MNVSARALWFIESHLSDSLSLETIAAAVGVPVFHLARAFSLAVGCGPAAYVRSRRLGEAARKLAAGAPDILALALESGYGSHEAFTRAFRDEWPLTEDQKLAVLARDLNRCIALGGNIYFLAKIGATDGRSFQQMAGSMTGMTEDEYRDMMIAGGRSVEGNRRVGEDGDAQAHRQPQGRAGRAA